MKPSFRQENARGGLPRGLPAAVTVSIVPGSRPHRTRPRSPSGPGYRSGAIALGSEAPFDSITDFIQW